MEKILCSISRVYAIIGCVENVFDAATPSGVTVFNIKYKNSSNFISKIIQYILLEIKMSITLIKISNRINLVAFFMEGDALLPVLTSKILGLKVVRILPSLISLKMVEFHNTTFYNLILYMNNIAYSYSDKIILYSSNLIKEWNLENYSSKILIASRHFIDFSQFRLDVTYSQRNDFIGYIGRFSEEKGVMNFIESVPLVIEKRPHLHIILIGDGTLTNNIEKYITKNGLENKVKLVGWISHENLPKYLNSLKLLVVPSYTEGLPNIILEAMACGTPVLATSVGAIPDIVKDEETGFIMENNLPSCIATNIIRASEFLDIENIIANSRKLVEENFSYKEVVKKYSELFSKI